jgi:ATP-dependent RNA helicase SUPV3L1/SUV3
LPAGALPSPAGRGLLYQLEQGLGSVLRGRADEQVRHLRPDDRRILGRLGLNVGELVVYSPELLTPAAVARRAALWSARTGRRQWPQPEEASIRVETELEFAFYHAVGYPPFGPLAIRADVAEETFRALVEVTRAGPAELPEELAAAIGGDVEDLAEVALAMGFSEIEAGRFALVRRTERRRRGRW